MSDIKRFMYQMCVIALIVIGFTIVILMVNFRDHQTANASFLVRDYEKPGLSLVVSGLLVSDINTDKGLRIDLLAATGNWWTNNETVARFPIGMILTDGYVYSNSDQKEGFLESLSPKPPQFNAWWVVCFVEIVLYIGLEISVHTTHCPCSLRPADDSGGSNSTPSDPVVNRQRPGGDRIN